MNKIPGLEVNGPANIIMMLDTIINDKTGLPKMKVLKDIREQAQLTIKYMEALSRDGFFTPWNEIRDGISEPVAKDPSWREG